MSDDEGPGLWGIVVLLVVVSAVMFGCKPGLNDKQKDQVRDIAADVAPDDQSARILELEARIDDIESRLGQ